MVSFTAHNIRLDDGTYTKPDARFTMENDPWSVSAKRILRTLFPQPRSVRVADLGCLEGGYAVEFARMGFDVLGIEVRAENMQACEYVKERVHLPNLRFVQDDARNVAAHGEFDAVFCCGLLYHLDKPLAFLETLGRVTRKLLIVQTHFASDTAAPKYNLSAPTFNEGLAGRWYGEPESRWASWRNERSFWIEREHLLGAIRYAGFDCVLEQFDSLEPNITEGLTRGYYATDARGTFLGIKTVAPT